MAGVVKTTMKSQWVDEWSAVEVGLEKKYGSQRGAALSRHQENQS